MFTVEQTAFMLIDVQGKLADIVQNSEGMLHKQEQLIQGMRTLDVPIICMEQYPKGLGPTKEQLRQHLEGVPTYEKIEFNGMLNEGIRQAVEQLGRKQFVLAGIESHICVYQTALSLKREGYDVAVVEDAVSSRYAEDKERAMSMLRHEGVKIVGVETILYELLQRAGTAEFKQILQYVK